MQMLGVNDTTLNAHGAVSEPTAREMAQGALSHSDAALSVSITGIAGPGGSDHKPEGMVCFGITTAKQTYTETQQFGPLGRSAVRQAAVDRALTLVLQSLDSI
jgi:nicotinamide-nucleotide amidase